MRQKFHDFIQQCQNWLIKQNLEKNLSEIYQLHILRCANGKKPMGGEFLWENYLYTLFSTDFVQRLFPRSVDLFSFTKKMNSLGQYLTKQDLLDVLNKSAFQILSSDELLELQECFYQFHHKREKWIHRERHAALQEAPRALVFDIQKENSFQDFWETGLFLHHCGYSYPIAKNACRAWTRWSGKETNYLEWWDLLLEWQGEKGERDKVGKAIELDYYLHLLSAEESPFVPDHQVCPKQPNCSSCFLRKKCSFFQNHRSETFFQKMEASLLADDSENLEERDLVIYLAGEEWSGTSSQEELLEEFLKHESGNMDRYHVTDQDLRFYLLLKGLIEIIRKSESEKILTVGHSFSGSEEIFKHLRTKLADEKQEAFYVLILDNKHRTLQLHLVTRGTLNQSLVHPREVFALAIKLRAAAIVLIHNHPSGDPKPSGQDLDVTNRLCAVGEVVGIRVLDHVVIGKNDFYSFVDEGDMPIL